MKTLTDELLRNVSGHITNTTQLRSLARQLKVDDRITESIITDHKGDINEAAFKLLLHAWEMSQPNRTEALQALSSALHHPDVGLEYFAPSVFWKKYVR